MMLVYRNGNRNSVNLHPTLIEELTMLQAEYNRSWCAVQEKLFIEEYDRECAMGALAGSPFSRGKGLRERIIK